MKPSMIRWTGELLKCSGTWVVGDMPFSPVHRARKLDQGVSCDRYRKLEMAAHFSAVLGTLTLGQLVSHYCLGLQEGHSHIVV